MTQASPLYVDTSFAVAYEAAVPCVTMTWRGYHTSEAFRRQNAEVMDLIAKHRATALLADIRDFTLIAAEDQAWLNAEWLPQAMAAGLRHAALVVPVFYFNKVAVQAVVNRIPAPTLRVEYFDTPEAGRAWLNTVSARS